MASWLRNLVYSLVLLCALPWLCWRRWRTGRYKSGLVDKLWGFSAAPAGSAPLVWLHGVSVGEVQLLRPLVEQWRARHPTWRVALSTTTDSGMELACKLFPNDVLLFYFPLDFTWAVKRTLRSLRPKLLILGELELWPNLIAQCRQQAVPVAVINGRLSIRSFERYQRLSWLARGMFRSLSLVAAQSEANAARFRACGAERTTIVTGSTKFDNVGFDRQADQVQHLRSLVGLMDNHRVWVMGSTQSGEELPAAQAFEQLRGEFPELRLIVVPRHPERFDQVASELEQTGLQVVRRSRLDQRLPQADWQILLVDTVGELRWWWGVAELAIVGGSFGRRGGQNMLEPAAYGGNLAFGPNTSNFRDIVELLLSGDAATQLSTLAEIEPWIRQQLRAPAAGQARGERARAIVASGQGALERTLLALEELIDEPAQNTAQAK